MDGYDLIGDIHGHADALRGLLRGLGYRERLGGYRHPTRQAIFLGDFIDRGPGQREVLELVRAMVENGAAQAVMGNHEFNALAFHTPDPAEPGQYLRPHLDKNLHQHRAFLDEYETRPAALADVLGWFYSLPLWLDLGELRVVHACWHPQFMRALAPELDAGTRLTPKLLEAASRQDTAQFDAVETLLKGLEADLPAGVSFVDKGGVQRYRTRLRWWLPAEGESWRSMALLPDATASLLPEEALPASISSGYPTTAPPVFVGHYWLHGTPAPQADNVACLDYSVAHPAGKLAAYRWDGETLLSATKFAWIDHAGNQHFGDDSAAG